MGDVIIPSIHPIPGPGGTPAVTTITPPEVTSTRSRNESSFTSDSVISYTSSNGPLVTGVALNDNSGSDGDGEINPLTRT